MIDYKKLLPLFTFTMLLVPVGGQYGRLIGNFTSESQAVDGTVYAVNEEILFIEGFKFNGMDPATFFWAGSSNRSNMSARRMIPYPKKFSDYPLPLNQTCGQNILLPLPAGTKIRDFRWLSVSARHSKDDLAYIIFPCDLDTPKPAVLSEFPRSRHGLRSRNVTVLDTKTFSIPELYYDGKGPDAFFWVGTGPQPNAEGKKVTRGFTLDRSNRPLCVNVLRRYQRDTITISLPNNWTVYDIDWLAVWSPGDEQNLGHVMIQDVHDVPWALGQNYIPCRSGSPSAHVAFLLVPFTLPIALSSVFNI